MRLFLLLAIVVYSSALAVDDTPATFRQYCVQCHGKAASGGISFDKLLPMGEQFQQWEKVADAIESKHMPPPQQPQPSDEERRVATPWIQAKLGEIANKIAGDPGRVALRRLTSGEYAYTIKDLTGLDIDTENDFVPDSVGGEGFTNFGDVQFMADASLERYLQAAKKVASHAVIGSGALGFFADPGKSGFELSALNRVINIHTTHGFRTTSAEGGRPFGLDKYG